MNTPIGRWVKDRRWWLTIVPPYAALAAVIVIGWGQYRDQADQAEIRAQAAVIAADLAHERAVDAQEEIDELQREADRSCADRQEARRDLIRSFELIYTVLPPRTAGLIAAQLANLDPITC